MSILADNELELNTPFARVIITIAEKDMWAKDEIEEWIFHGCGVPTPKDHERVMRKFDNARKALREFNKRDQHDTT